MGVDMAARKKQTLPRPVTDAELRRAVHGKAPDITAPAALRVLLERRAAATSMLTALAKAADRQVALRTIAAVALGRRNTAASRSALMELLESDDPQLVRRAAEGLGRTGGQEALDRLKMLRPRDPVVRRAVGAAKTLLAYRLDDKSGRLSPVDKDERIALKPSMRSRAFGISMASSATLERMRERISEEVPALSAAPSGALELDCGGGRYLVVLSRDLEKGPGLARLTQASAIMGAVLERDEVDGTCFLTAYLLAHPGPHKSVRLFAMKGSGVVAYAGELEFEDGRNAARFSVQALKTRFSQPLALEGRIEAGEKLKVTFERAEVATQFARSQPPPKRPRRISQGVLQGTSE